MPKTALRQNFISYKVAVIRIIPDVHFASGTALPLLFFRPTSFEVLVIEFHNA